MKRVALFLILALCLVSAGCRKKLSQEDATRALVASGVFNDPIEMRVYIGPTGLDCATMRAGNAAVLQAAGIIAEKNHAYVFTDAGKKEFDAVGAKIVEKRPVFVGSTDNVTCEDVQWSVILARKKLISVPVIQVDGSKGRVQYTYEWETNSVGKNFVEKGAMLDKAEKIAELSIAPTIVPAGPQSTVTYLHYSGGKWVAE